MKVKTKCPICGVYKISVRDHIKAVHKQSKEYKLIKERERDSGYYSLADEMTWMRI